MKVIIAIIFSLLGIIAFPNKAIGSSTAIGVYPPILEIKARTGPNVIVPITVVNESQKELEIGISLRGFDPSLSKPYSPIFYPEEKTPDSLLKFLNTVEITDGENAIKSFNLYPKESKQVYLSIPAAITTPKEFYFSVIFSTTPEAPNAEETTVQSKVSVGTLVFTSLNEAKNTMPEVQLFTTDFFHTSSPIRFQLNAQNTGDSFQNVSGKIVIYNMFGKETGTTELKPVIIPANTSRVLEEKEGEEIIWTDSFPLGIYSAKALISYENAPTVSKETRFMVIPLFPLLFTITVLFLILGIGVRVLKKLKLQKY